MDLGLDGCVVAATGVRKGIGFACAVAIVPMDGGANPVV